MDCPYAACYNMTSSRPISTLTTHACIDSRYFFWYFFFTFPHIIKLYVLYDRQRQKTETAHCVINSNAASNSLEEYVCFADDYHFRDLDRHTTSLPLSLSPSICQCAGHSLTLMSIISNS